MTPKLMTAVRLFVCLLIALLASSGLVRAQTLAPAVRALDLRRSEFQQELNRLAAEGYEIALAEVDPDLLVVQKSVAAARRTYLFADGLSRFLREKRVEPGYRVLPQTMSSDRHGYVYYAVFEKVDGDDQQREYVFVDASSAGDLEKKARREVGDSFSPVAIKAGARGVAAIFERKRTSEPWKIVATSRTGTMEQELDAAAAQGYRIVSGSGRRELVYALTKPPEAPPVEYQLVATTKDTGLERELSAAAGQGFRLVAPSLAALQGGSGSGRFLPARLSNETAAVMEKVPAAKLVTYKVVGARRLSTIQKELSQAASEGFVIVAALVGFEETVAVLERVESNR